MISNSKETCRWIEDGTKNKEKERERETEKRKYATRGFRVVTFLIHIVRSLRAYRAGRLKIDNCSGKRLLVVHCENEAKRNGYFHPAFFRLLSIFSKRKGKVNGHKREINSFRSLVNAYFNIIFAVNITIKSETERFNDAWNKIFTGKRNKDRINSSFSSLSLKTCSEKIN